MGEQESAAGSARGGLTLKRLGHFFRYLILFPNVVQQICNIFIRNWSNKLNV